MNSTKLRSKRSRAGFALLEISIALVVFAVATSILAQTFRAGHQLRGQAREQFLAMSAAQSTLESMRGTRFNEIIVRYDEDPFNDPGGPGTAHGSSFAIEGLSPASDDADDFEGEIILPVVNLGTAVVPDFEVRENQGDARLGLPRDLNGDAIIDTLDHTGDAIILPILVRVRWRGRNGDRQLDFYSALTEVMP